MTQAWNLSQLANKVNTSGQLDATTGISGTLPVANGGTGVATIAANGVLIGNGTGAVTTVAPGASNNVLVSNGTAWTSATFTAYAGFSTVIFASSGTWTPPSGVSQARITVIGGGGAGGAGNGTNFGGTGGNGGGAVAFCTGISGSVTITIGAGGNSGASGNTSSAVGTGVSISATGGAPGSTGVAGSVGADGVGTVTTGTALRTGGAIKLIAAFNGSTATSNAIGSTATPWSVTSIYLPGAHGIAGTTTSSAGNGGIGGVVMIEY